jgi:hypothetical protein
MPLCLHSDKPLTHFINKHKHISLNNQRFSWQCEFRLCSSAWLCRVDFWLFINVSKKHATSIFRVEETSVTLMGYVGLGGGLEREQGGLANQSHASGRSDEPQHGPTGARDMLITCIYYIKIYKSVFVQE